MIISVLVNVSVHLYAPFYVISGLIPNINIYRNILLRSTPIITGKVLNVWVLMIYSHIIVKIHSSVHYIGQMLRMVENYVFISKYQYLDELFVIHVVLLIQIFEINYLIQMPLIVQYVVMYFVMIVYQW